MGEVYLHVSAPMYQTHGDPGSIRKLTDRRVRTLFTVVAGITSLSAVLRLLHLGSKSLWVDECASVIFAQQPWPSFWKTMWHGEANMLSYYLLLRGWVHLGNTEFIVRSLSVIPAVGTVFVVYILGKRLFSAQVGLVSALLLAVNACHVAYSQEARGYALLLLLSSLSILTFVTAIERATTRSWLLYALVTVAAVYTHFFAGFLIVAQWVSLAFLPRRAIDLRKFYCSASLITVCIFPALWFVLRKDVGQIDFIPNPGILELYRLILFLTSYGGKVFGILLAIIYLACLGVSLRIFLTNWRHSRQSIESWRLALLLSCVFLPVLLDISISHLGKQIFYYRYLLICLPALVVLAARGFCCLRSRRVVVTALVAVSALSMATVWRYYAKPKEDWREATHYLLSNSRPDDTVVSYPWYAQEPLKYYEEQLRPSANMLRLVPAQMYSVNAPQLNRFEVVWLLSCREDAYLRLFRKGLSRAYPYHHEWRYDGAITVEQYSNQELTAHNDQDINSVARAVSPGPLR